MANKRQRLTDDTKQKRKYFKKESNTQQCSLCDKQFANQNCLLVHLPTHAEPGDSNLDEWNTGILSLIRKYGIFRFSYMYGIQTDDFINQVWILLIVAFQGG